MSVYNLVFAIVSTAAVLYASLKYLHMLQLESYQGRLYAKWMKKHLGGDMIPCLMLGFIAIALRSGWVFFYYSYYTLSDVLWYAGDAAYVLMMVFYGFVYAKKRAKKPLKFTGRAIRLLVVMTILSLLFAFELFSKFNINSWGGFLTMNIVRYLPGMLLPIFVLVSYLITYPIEECVKKWYFNDAKKKLAAREDVQKIGITGSYGKTSTKFILGTLLSEEKNTLVTPSSFNTPMGITRVIREQLLPEHEVFVAEMGARYKGDIKELCTLVAPKIGIITSVGKQHLETFGSIENVTATKAELLAALPDDGIALINGDNEICREMYESCALEKKYLFGIEGEGLFMRAGDIHSGSFGSHFTLYAADGKSMACTTTLLGRHNILNITGAAACAYCMGLTMEQIASSIQKLQPVEHRLQLIAGAVNVIDDAFNSNPEGARNALQTLKEFPGRHIVVTPGMVELGSEEEQLNEEFGRQMADCADIAILVGKRQAEPMLRGLLDAGFDEGNVVRAKDLAEASEMLKQYTVGECAVLFENDLPDNYDE